MLVRELMTSPAVTIGPDNEAVEAARLLDRLSLTSLPVVDADLRLLVVEKDPSAPGRLNVDVTYTVVLGLHQVAFVHRVTI